MPTYNKILRKINRPENIQIFDAIFNVVSQHSAEIAKNFYREMLNNPQAASFLNHDEVKKRLTLTMVNWINSAFLYRESQQAVEEYIHYQLKTGHLHAKIGLPISLVNYGIYLIKQDISQLLVNADFTRQDLGKALTLSNQVLDCALQIMNESYEGDLVVNEKDSQAFKIQFSTHHLAFDCAHLRTSLSDWMRDLLLNIQRETFDVSCLLPLKKSNFGLWMAHKGKLFLSNRPEFISLVGLLDDMDEMMEALIQHFHDEAKKQDYLKELNNLVSQASWVLGGIAKDIIDQDNGRDTLTRLFNRRYLDTVMRHETASSLKSGASFGVVMVDIDFFKKINDDCGHDNGDRVLEQLADILIHEVRAGDFVFRLGGEEFLIVLGDINVRVLTQISEKIRMAVANNVFRLAEQKTLALTVSIGTALHDGHPDFNRTLKLADAALYQAKQNGRNQVVVAEQRLTA